MLKVLIIDDDSIVLFIQEKMLKKYGITDAPISFQDARKAIDFLKIQKSGDIFLILLDINMPGMNGWDVLDVIREMEISEKVFVFMVTSSIDNYDKEKAKNYKNVISFIEKPISVDNCIKIKEHPELKPYLLD
ncbi:response regulator [Gillisia limnaea]|uniref:Response regulator receiver protein n=1 Tax=Gillisia limnaea (strain DSM 15749 / LMG 21470 / R-8282) TaxID=865937 RepID=H2BRJ3_GILLR|nr:response regulator [Gillisia limnaea]EHQ04512.1 response regulator receiver protein [Gillisia limnaea DSM 15749]